MKTIPIMRYIVPLIMLGTSAYAATISGHVYQDTAADQFAGGRKNLDGVTVKLFDSSNNLVGTAQQTQNDGSYSFTVTTDGDYHVVVDSRTINPDENYNTGYSLDDVWAEQTYGPAGAQCANPEGLLGAGDPYVRTSTGPCYGGKTAASDTDPNSPGTAEHIATVTVSGGSDVSDVDFGFSFVAVTNTNDSDDDTAANRYAQGTLRQFIQNVNAIQLNWNAKTMRFVPVVLPTEGNTTNQWWQITVQDLDSSVHDELVDKNYADIDGRAYSYADGTTIRDTNPGQLDTGLTVGVGDDEVLGTGDETNLTAIDLPELEIVGSDDDANVLTFTSYSTIKNVAIYGPENASAIYVDDEQIILQSSFLGARADASDPGSGNRVKYGASILSSDNLNTGIQAENDYIAYTNGSGYLLDGGGNDITQNLIEYTGYSDATASGIEVKSIGELDLVHSYIRNTAGYGVDFFNVTVNADTNSKVEQSTITKTGIGSQFGQSGQTFTINVDAAGGVRTHSSDHNDNDTNMYQINDNYIFETGGHGIVVIGSSTNILQNAFHDNKGLAIDLTGPSGEDNGDGVTPNNGTEDPDYGNDRMNYPVITSIEVYEDNLTIKGYVGKPGEAYTGATGDIVFYVAKDDGNNNGELIEGDGLSVPHGEGMYLLVDEHGSRREISCVEVDNNFTCDINVSETEFGKHFTLDPDAMITAMLKTDKTDSSEFGNSFPLPKAKIALTKAARPLADTNGDGIVGGVGDVITYDLNVTNTGDYDLTDVNITDANATVDNGGIVGDLAIGESKVLTATHTITADDIKNGGVYNQATASGRGPNSTTVQDSSNSTVVSFFPTNPSSNNAKKRSSVISGRYWIDHNLNGIYDAGDSPMPSDTIVELLDASGKPMSCPGSQNNASQCTTSLDDQGRYRFDVPEGSYQVRFILPPDKEADGYLFNDLNRAGAHLENNSYIYSITIKAGETKEKVDAAIYCSCSDVVSDSIAIFSQLWSLVMPLALLLGGLVFVRREEIH